MRHVILTVCLAGLFCTDAAGQGTFDLTRKPAGQEQMPGLRMGRRFWRGQTEIPADFKGVPEGASWFFNLPLGPGRRAVVVPGQKPQLLVDTDGDNDVADETPLTGKASGNSIDFGTATIKVGGGGSATVHLTGMAQKPGDPPRYLIVMPGQYCTGTAKLAGTPHAVTVVDTNLNGRFNDTFSGTYDRSATDSLSIDLNGNGTFDSPRGLDGPFEVMPLARRLRVAGAYYDVTVAADGSAITLERCEPGHGTLDLGVGGAEMFAYSDYGMYRTATSEKGTVRLPAGRYMVVRLMLTKQGEAGEPWQLTMNRPPKALAPLEVRKGETHRATIGPPLVAAVNVRKANQRAYLGLKLKGRGGEEYVPGVTKGRRRMPPPEFRIVSEDGKVLQTGKFEYG